jgi:aromatic ring hydroxylase
VVPFRLVADVERLATTGRKVGDVTQDPALRRPVAAMAMLYDCQIDHELRPKMTYCPDDAGDEAGLSFIIPRSHDDLVRRREAMRIWADATFGLMGRSPDYLNTLLAAFADAPDFFALCGPECAANVQRYYRFCRDNDLFLTHAIVNPQVDRSKSSSEQADAYAHLRVVEETRDGLIVRGAKMLATHGPTADEILIYPLPFSLRLGEEKYALAFGIPTDASALAIALTRSVRTDSFLHVQEQLGECLGYLQLIEGAILLSEQKAQVTDRGTLRPALEPLQALRYHIPRFYERMVAVTQVLGAGALLATPTQADLDSEIGADIRRYYRGADGDAQARIRLSKLAWDATGTQFGQRQLQYERYYAGDPVRLGASIYLIQDHASLLAIVDRALRPAPDR